MPNWPEHTPGPGNRLDLGQMLHALGGWWGILASILPTVVFVLLQAFVQSLPVAVGGTIAVTVVLAVVQLLRRSGTGWGSLGAGVLLACGSALLAAFTGRAGDNFVPGIVTNAVFLLVLGISVVVRRPLLWVGVSWFAGASPTQSENSRTAGLWATVVWMGVFGLRLAVEIPLYVISLRTGSVLWLGGARVILGVPLFALGMLMSWFLLRSGIRAGSAGTHPRA